MQDWITIDAAVQATNRQVPTGAGGVRGCGRQIVAASPATYAIATRDIVLAASAGGYTFTDGDLWFATGGAGFDVGKYYQIGSSPNANTVRLKSVVNGQTGRLPIADNADTTGFIVPLGSLCKDSVLFRITEVLVLVNEIAAHNIEILQYDTAAQILTIPIAGGQAVPFRVKIGGAYGVTIPKGFCVDANTGSSTLSFNLYFEKVQ